VKLGYNAMLLHGRYTGVHRAGWELLKTLAERSSDEIRVYASRAFETPGWSPPPATVRVHRTWFSARRRSLRVIYENLFLARRARREGCELLHCPAYTLPVWNLLPTVVTVHDVIALTHPKFVSRASASHMKRAIPRAAKLAHMIIVPSEAARKALMKATEAKPARIRVVPFGVAEHFKPVRDGSVTAAFREQFGIPEHYVLFVGRMEPKKNLPNLLKAFFAAVMAKKLPHSLVLAGPDGASAKPLKKLIAELNFAERVLRIEHVPEESLPVLYSAADCLAMPSVVEGFGFPVLEAMACGTPVVTSKDAALRELAPSRSPSAAHDDLKGMRAALERILTDEKLRARQVKAGLERAVEFTWKRTAERTREVYAETLEQYEKLGGGGAGEGGGPA